MGKREKLSEQTGSPSTPGETFLKAAGQYAGLEDVVQHYWPGCDENRESPRSYERGAFLRNKLLERNYFPYGWAV